MEEDIPNFTESKYGLVAGPVFTIVFAVFVLIAGGMSSWVNRVLIIAIVNILWSCTSLGTAFVKKFWQVCSMRMLLGVFEGF